MNEKLQKDIEILCEMLENSRHTVFFGGAGMSTESGIPDFRGTGGLYTADGAGNEYYLSRACLQREPEEFFKFFENLLADKDFGEFLLCNNDITVFGVSELTHSDYVETYRSLCKLLIKGTDEDMPWFKDMLTKIEDPYLEELLEVRESIEFRSIYDDADSEEDDEDILE